MKKNNEYYENRRPSNGDFNNNNYYNDRRKYENNRNYNNNYKRNSNNYSNRNQRIQIFGAEQIRELSKLFEKKFSFDNSNCILPKLEDFFKSPPFEIKEYFFKNFFFILMHLLFLEI